MPRRDIDNDEDLSAYLDALQDAAEDRADAARDERLT